MAHPRNAFENFDWPITSGDHIKWEYLEDIRKYIWLLKVGVSEGIEAPNPEDGHGTFSGPDSGITWRVGERSMFYYGEWWVNHDEIDSDNKHAPPEAESGDLHLETKVNNNGSSYKCTTNHYSGNEFDATKWSSITYDENLPQWSRRTVYHKYQWLGQSEAVNRDYIIKDNIWTLTPSKMHYHHYDENSHRKCIYYKTGRTGAGMLPKYEGHTYQCEAHQMLPAQADYKEFKDAVKYLDTGLIKHFIGNKLAFERNIITTPQTQGAIYGIGVTGFYTSGTNTWNYVRTSGLDSGMNADGLSNQYINGGYNAYPYGTGERSQLECKKVGSSYQAMIEHVVNMSQLPNTGDTLTLWKLMNPKGDTETTEAYDLRTPSYLNVCDPAFGCNESGFEVYKKNSGSYDWYFDDVYTYNPLQHEIALAVIAEFSPIQGGYTAANYPLPVGTWRRTWKYSLGRIRPLIRPQEMGAPSQGSYSGRTDAPIPVDEAGEWGYLNGFQKRQPIIWASGTYTSNAPGFPEFFETIETISSIEQCHLTGYNAVLKISGDFTNLIKKANVVIIGNDVTDFIDCYVMKEPVYQDGKTIIEVDKDCTGYTKLCHDSRVSARHDPIDVQYKNNGTSWIACPMYILSAALLNEMHDMLHQVQYEEINVPLDQRGILATGTENDDEGPRAYNLNALKRAMANIPSLADWWDLPYIGGYTEGAHRYTYSVVGGGSSPLVSQNEKSQDIWEDPQRTPDVHPSYEHYVGDIISSANGGHTTQIAFRALSGGRHFLIGKSVRVRFKCYDYNIYNDLSVPENNIRYESGSAGLLSSTYYNQATNPGYGPPTGWPPRIVAASLVCDGGYLVCRMNVPSPPSVTWGVNQEYFYTIGGIVVAYVYYSGPVSDVHTIEWNFDKVPQWVWDRGEIGFIEPPTAPEEDLNPPVPLHPNMWKKPQAFFVYRGDEATPYFELRVKAYSVLVEDLDGSDPVGYQFADETELVIEPTTYGSERTIERVVATFTPEELLPSPSEPESLISSITNPSGNIARAACTNTNRFRVGDMVGFFQVEGLNETFDYELTAVESSYVEFEFDGDFEDINLLGGPKVKSEHDLAGFDFTDWRNSEYWDNTTGAGILMKIRAKDNASAFNPVQTTDNIGEWTKENFMLDLLPPDIWPYDVKDTWEVENL